MASQALNNLACYHCNLHSCPLILLQNSLT